MFQKRIQTQQLAALKSELKRETGIEQCIYDLVQKQQGKFIDVIADCITNKSVEIANHRNQSIVLVQRLEYLFLSSESQF